MNNYETYGQLPSGARHQLGVVKAKSERGALIKIKRAFPEYKNFNFIKV